MSLLRWKDLNEGVGEELLTKQKNNYTGVKKALIEEIEKNLTDEDLSKVEELLTQLKEGGIDSGLLMSLTQSTNLYNFYLKYEDEIDDKLNEDGWFQIAPFKDSITSLYDYMIEGIKKALDLFLTEMYDDLFKS